MKIFVITANRGWRRSRGGCIFSRSRYVSATDASGVPVLISATNSNRCSRHALNSHALSSYISTLLVPDSGTSLSMTCLCFLHCAALSYEDLSTQFGFRKISITLLAMKHGTAVFAFILIRVPFTADDLNLFLCKSFKTATAFRPDPTLNTSN